jgi:hypothetical protein
MAALKKFVFGVLIGLVIAFPLGINFGRDMPLLSNPFAKPDIQNRIKVQAEGIVEDTKSAIHDATRPQVSEMEKRVRR